ncbi:MAG: hypothetical protein ACFFD4_16760, partial [Candidatus Odinarchaeota archaeon]
DDVDTSIFDDVIFEIEEAKTITVTNPVTSSVWASGETKQIQWTTTGNINYVDIYVYKGYDQRYYQYNEPNDGSFTWTLPGDMTLELTGGYTLKMLVTVMSMVTVIILK